MKNYFYSSLIILLVACSGNEPTTNTETNDESNNAAKDTLVPAEETVENFEVKEIPLKEKSQVNDYADYFLQNHVVDQSGNLNFDKGVYYYYQVLDVKNGYAVVSGSFEGEYVFVVWRMANGNDLVGKTSSSCGPVCDYSVNFYEITPEGDVDVTATIVPAAEIEKQRKKMEELAVKEGVVESSDDSQLLYILPQKGTSIDVYLSMSSNEVEFPILTLSWDKTKFNISKKYNEITGGN